MTKITQTFIIKLVMNMKYYQKLCKLGIFNLNQAARIINNDNPVQTLSSYVKSGFVRKIKHNLYICVDLASGNDIVDKRVYGFVVGCKKAAAAKMDACEDAVQSIGAQVLTAKQNHIFFFFYKKGYNLRGEKLADDKHEQAKKHTDGNPHAQGLPAPVMPAGSCILRSCDRNGRQHG